MSLTYEEIRPVVVTAPTARNGVTLLQRLLNSSRQIIVYGENKHLCEHMPHMTFMAQNVHQSCGEETQRTRDRFLNETTEFWTSGLWPDTAAYVDQAVQAFRSFVHLYQACSEQYGFQCWGIKHPLAEIAALGRLLALLPNGLFIYIYRNLFDVARSSKARKFVATPKQYEDLAGAWNDSLKVILPARADNLLVIKYETMMRAPETWISRIESFTGISGIKRDVMKRKLNTFPGDTDQGRSPTEYIEPEPLTDEEAAILREHAGEMLAAAGYADRVAARPVPVVLPKPVSVSWDQGTPPAPAVMRGPEHQATRGLPKV